jgi:IstB-like ATP binding protein
VQSRAPRHCPAPSAVYRAEAKFVFCGLLSGYELGKRSGGVLRGLKRGVVTFAAFTCQPLGATNYRIEENQRFREPDDTAEPLENRLFLASVTMLFEVFSQRYERGSTIVTSNLPFEEWTSVFGAERLTGALLDRLTHHVHILSMNGESYRLAQSARRRKLATAGAEHIPADEIVDPLTGEITPK